MLVMNNVMKMPPAIVLCASKAGLAVARALGSAGVGTICVSFGKTNLACKSRYVDSCHDCPDPAESEMQFLEFLLSKSERWSGGVLFPTDDASLLAVSKYKEQLANYYRVVAEDWAIVRQLLEKVHTYKISTQCGVPCPQVEPVTGVSQAIDFARQVGFPCLIKPSVSHTFFSRYRVKMVVVHSVNELTDWLARLEEYPDELMLCEFIPGNDTCGANYNSFYLDGAPYQEFTARKVRLNPTRIGFPTVVFSQHTPEIITLGRALIESIGYRGFSCTEFKWDQRDNTFKLMEVNARPNFSGMLAFRCGINFPYISYRDAIGLDLPPAGQSQENGIYWIDEERDFKGLFSSLWHGKRAAGAHLRPYSSKPVFAVFSLNDPMPSLQQVAQLTRRVFAGG